MSLSFAPYDLVKKYDVPVPRYTSYPTVPHWDIGTFSEEEWRKSVKRCFDETNNQKGISLYIHLPFCESLCTYCACNTRITKNHKVEERYLNAVIQEWDSYRVLFSETPRIRELHLGGGTPTFFSAVNLERLLNGIFKGALVIDDHAFSFEGHPNNTTREHLQTLFNAGFRRVSFGVQDLDPKVQQAIHRIQSLESLQSVTYQSREIGYQSISYDLIYGLPYQTLETVTNTVERVIAMQPDRLAFYSYAHVPWIKPGQRGYEDADLPTDVVKRGLYEKGREIFQKAGYRDIGMDHFALPHDELALAVTSGSLHRNFMGYTTTQTDLLLGLGTSAISDAKYAYAQNEKNVERYEALVENMNLAIVKGHVQSQEDLMRKQSILDIACRGKLDAIRLDKIADSTTREKLSTMEKEGIITLESRGLQVTPVGRMFIRNICSVFDVHLKKTEAGKQVFSKAI